MSARIVFRVAGLGQVGFGFLLSHALSLEGDAVGIVDDAVEDVVSGSGLQQPGDLGTDGLVDAQRAERDAAPRPMGSATRPDNDSEPCCRSYRYRRECPISCVGD